MIDFALSNCRHSLLDTIGVVTQYRPEALHRHIGLGSAWLEKPEQGEVAILSSGQPHVGHAGYTGTADAVYRNWPFIVKHSPDTILVLSGDHIYHMDYRSMLQRHWETGAEATLAVTPVPMEEAGRFGIMKTDAAGKITEFKEKPKMPASNLASMGIYMFNTSFLERYLEEDAVNEASSHDFGKDVIPAMLAGQGKLHAYEFAGYWKDVGTIESLWEAHMDLLGSNPRFASSPAARPLYSGYGPEASRYIDTSGTIRNSIVCADCAVHGQVEGSVISAGVTVGPDSRIVDSVIMPNAQIGSGVTICKAIIGEGAVIRDGAEIGSPDGAAISVVGDREYVGQDMPSAAYMTAGQFQAELIL
ncbi:Glucose-1-phosphate adenylyltransferase [Paenibacillus konkukensis]|uniref:Glucose-1-phosphate adenylyltransferase n=2 Tax=Paenibacillus TaxID=44249 RepID=A0ABY4RTE6_9BACL|nr:Glucose-1-phosphate adenylyltransferase [Paenibacillus konkukensis]